MDKSIVHVMNIVVNYIYNHHSHTHQIGDLRPTLLQTPADLIYRVLDGPILWLVWGRQTTR